MAKNKDGLEAGQIVDFETWRKVESERNKPKTKPKPKPKPKIESGEESS